MGIGQFEIWQQLADFRPGAVPLRQADTARVAQGAGCIKTMMVAFYNHARYIGMGSVNIQRV